MKWLNSYRIGLMLVGFVAAIVLGGGSAKADFVFGEPTNLGPTVNSSANESGPNLLAGGLSLYFRSARVGGYGKRDLWLATRPTINDAWGEPVNLGPLVNSSNEEGQPSISVEDLSLYFNSKRPGGYGGNDIWVSTRATTDEPWGESVNLGPSINSSANDAGPSISADGLKLYFNSNKDIWVTTRATKNADWSAPMNLGPAVNSSASDNAPSISADGLWLFLHSRRPGGYGDTDLWLATRPTTNDAWSEPVNLGPPINTSYGDSGACISVDGRILYFNSDRPEGIGEDDIWQVSIDPIVDLNGDGIVDAADMCIMVDYWGTDEPLCDIGPMPWGDGIVDVQDLIVLSEHLFEEVNDPTLIAHWPLDEAQGVIAYDSAANSDGVLVGGPVWQPDSGVTGGALQFDGIDDYVSTDPVLNPADPEISSGFSVIAWIRDGAPGQAVLSQADGASWLCTDFVEGNLMTELKASGRGATGPLLSQIVITDSEWHRIGLVWDGSYRYLYVDGAEVAKDAAPLSGLEDAYGGLHFGVGSTLAPGTFFSGLIDDMRIYNRVVAP